jgi:hypothetical protein
MGRSGPGQGITPEGYGEDPTDPQITDGNGNLSPTAMDAIIGGVKHIAGMLSGGGQQGAIPSNQNQAVARQQLMNGEGIPTDQEVQAIDKAVDPKGQLDTSMANIAGLESMYRYYSAQGNGAQANAVAAEMLRYTQMTAAKYGSEAYNEMHRGDMQKGLDTLVKGYDQVPDGRSATAKLNPDGSATVTQKDMNGKPINQMTASPEQIFNAAVGLKNGSLYWSMLNDAVAPKLAASQQPLSAADQQGIAQVTGEQAGAPGGQAQTQAPTPTPAPLQPQQGAIPTSPQATPAAATGPVTQQSSQPQEEGAIPTQASTGPMPAPQAQSPAPGQAEQFGLSGQDPAVQKNWGAIQQIYAHLPQPPRPIQGMTARGIGLMNAAYKERYVAAKSQADKMIDAMLSNTRATMLQDRDANNQTARMTSQNQHDVFMEQQRQNAPLPPNDRALSESEGDQVDAWTHAGNILPQVFAKPGTDPVVAKTNFASAYDPDTQSKLSAATVDIARYSQTSPHVAAIALRGMAVPTKPADQEDTPAFQAQVDKSTGLVNVALKDGMTVRMHPDTFRAIMGVRAATRVAMQNKATATDEQSRRDSARGAQEGVLSDRIRTRASQRMNDWDQRLRLGNEYGDQAGAQ